MSFALVQSHEGSTVTSGSRVATAQYQSNVTSGNLLVAVVRRSASSAEIAITGVVTDNQGNKWKQAHQVCNTTDGSATQGLDVWVCESAGGGNAPTVTATLNQWTDGPVSAVTVAVLEYSGATGYELVDAIGQASITGTSQTVTSNYAVAQAHEVVLTAVAGNMTAAATPSGYTSRVADTTGFFIADKLDSGGSLTTQSAAWTGMTSATAGAAIIVTFAPTGATSGPHILQMSAYGEAPPVSYTPPMTSFVVPALPVNPTAGSTLLLVINAASYVGMPVEVSGILSVTDTAGNIWRKFIATGPDRGAGGQFTLFVCDSCNGGFTQPTFTVDTPAQTQFSLLVEVGGLTTPLTMTGSASATRQSVGSLSTLASVPAGGMGIFTIGSFATPQTVPGAGWTQVYSDIPGAINVQIQHSTASGVLTGTIGGGAVSLAAMFVASLASNDMSTTASGALSITAGPTALPPPGDFLSAEPQRAYLPFSASQPYQAITQSGATASLSITAAPTLPLPGVVGPAEPSRAQPPFLPGSPYTASSDTPSASLTINAQSPNSTGLASATLTITGLAYTITGAAQLSILASAIGFFPSPLFEVSKRTTSFTVSARTTSFTVQGRPISYQVETV